MPSCSSACQTLGLLENTPAGTVLHAVRLHTTDQTLQAAHCLQQAMDEMHWEQRLRLRTKEGSSKRHSRSSSGSASPSTPIGIASTTVAGVKPLPVPRPKSPPRYPGLGAAADDGPRPRPSLYPPPSPSVFNPVFVDATPPRPCAVYTKTVDVVAVTQPPLGENGEMNLI